MPKVEDWFLPLRGMVPRINRLSVFLKQIAA
jgi:hypothetical protein